MWSRVRRDPQARGAWEPPELPLGPPSPAPGRGAEAPSPPQRTCPIQRNRSPRTSPSGTPMTLWTKSRALSQRTRRVTGWGRGQCWDLPSPLTQLLLMLGIGGGRGEGTSGPRSARSQPLTGGPGAAHGPCSRAHRFCVADGLYRQSAPAFRGDPLNSIEVGARVAWGQGPCSRGAPGLRGKGQGAKDQT